MVYKQAASMQYAFISLILAFVFFAKVFIEERCARPPPPSSGVRMFPRPFRVFTGLRLKNMWGTSHPGWPQKRAHREFPV